VLKWSAFYLAIVLALMYTGMGVFYLLPSVYHPFSGDTVNVTRAHLPFAGTFLALAVAALIAGRFSRPSARS
jgi:hypothetical protein